MKASKAIHRWLTPLETHLGGTWWSYILIQLNVY